MKKKTLLLNTFKIFPLGQHLNFKICEFIEKKMLSTLKI